MLICVWCQTEIRFEQTQEHWTEKKWAKLLENVGGVHLKRAMESTTTTYLKFLVSIDVRNGGPSF
jgi:hypothetical protein